MLSSWLRILPLFIVERIARKYGERLKQGSVTLISGPKGTYFHEREAPPAPVKTEAPA